MLHKVHLEFALVFALQVRVVYLGRAARKAVVATGAHLAAEVSNRGLKCARLFSIWDSPVAALVQQGLEVEYTATIQHDDRNEDQDDAIAQTINQIRALPYRIVAVIPGAETGVELADCISHRMGLRSLDLEGLPFHTVLRRFFFSF